jgi:hypothetical protein
MAEFKKIPDGGSGDGPFDFITAEAAGQIAMSYWPAILGGITLFILIILGRERVAIAVSIAVILLQGWLILG